MNKKCPTCGKENAIGVLWCYNCNTKLYRTINEPIEEKPIEDEFLPIKTNSTITPPKPQITLTLGKMFLIAIITISILLAFFTYLKTDLTTTSEFDEIISSLNDDFYYGDGQIITSNGKTYTISDINDYKLNGKITDVTTVTKKPGQTTSLSFLQSLEFLTRLFTHPDNTVQHNHQLVAYMEDQLFNWQIECNTTENYTYNDTNSKYIIPLNENIRKQLQENISIDDTVEIEGTLVSIRDQSTAETDQESTSSSTSQTQSPNQNVLIVKKVTITKKE